VCFRYEVRGSGGIFTRHLFLGRIVRLAQCPLRNTELSQVLWRSKAIWWVGLTTATIEVRLVCKKIAIDAVFRLGMQLPDASRATSAESCIARLA